MAIRNLRKMTRIVEAFTACLLAETYCTPPKKYKFNAGTISASHLPSCRNIRSPRLLVDGLLVSSEVELPERGLAPGRTPAV